MNWTEFAERQPGLAKVGRERLLEPGVVLVSTIRRDGAPRLSPVEPLVMDDDLWLSMLWHSAKATDLLRDSRILVHSIITSRDGTAGEFKIRGTARAETDPSVHQQYADEVGQRLGWSPTVGKFHLFAVDIAELSFIRYDKASGDQFVAMFPAGREFVRRATSATSLGATEPWHELLVP